MAQYMQFDDRDRVPEHSEDQARRAAKRVGLKARKSRWRAGSVDNFGGFMIIDPMRNLVVAGARFDFTADDVVAFCAEREPQQGYLR